MTAALRPIRGIRRLWISALSGADTRTGAPAFMGRQINNGYGRFKMNILILKLCLVFLVIIAILWMKRPLFLAISGGLAGAVLLYGIRLQDALLIMGKSMVSKDTITVVLSFYFITFLQRMLEG